MSEMNDMRARTAATLLACACAISSPLAADPTHRTVSRTAVATEFALIESEREKILADMEDLQAEVNDITARIRMKVEEMAALNQRAEILTGLLAEYHDLQGPVAENGSEIPQ